MISTKALRTLKAPLIRGKYDNGTNSKVKNIKVARRYQMTTDS